MKMLSDDDLDIRNMSDEELALAWDLWFDLAQTTNDGDPLYTHGVFQNVRGKTQGGHAPCQSGSGVADPR